MGQMYQHTNGILLRKMEIRHLSMLQALKGESWFGTHNIAIINMDEQLRWYETITNNPNQMVLIAEDDQELVGTYKIIIDQMNQKCDVAYNTFKGQRGKGYCKKLVEAGVAFCFEILNLHRIDIEVLENNIASAKCAEYVGFVKEGVKRKSIHKCDQWLDSIVYGLLREDWKPS